MCVMYNDISECSIDEQDIIFAKINYSIAATIATVKYIDCKYTNCRILINDTVVLDGQINEVKSDGSIYTYIIRTIVNSDLIPSNTDGIINKFKTENPNIFCTKIQKLEQPPVKDIDAWIIKDSVITKINHDLPVYELNLNIKASWLRSVYGAVDLTNKIKYALAGKLLSTITPNKFKHSWFKAFTSLYSNKTSRQTKYFVTHSKLTEESNTPITFNNKLTLRKTDFQYELSIGWEYEQLEYEEIQCKIVNKLVPKTSAKILNIDLHNVQEYISNSYQQSFFKTDNGEKISNIILREAIKYIENSLYNIYVQFRVPINYSTFSLYQPIELNGNTLYIQELEYVYEAKESYISVTCIGSQYKHINGNDIKLKLTNDNQKNVGVGDVIDKIIIQNDADVQIPKVKKFVLENFHNNKNALREFLYNNQTRLIIKTKPLKTSYINKTIYKALPINLE